MCLDSKQGLVITSCQFLEEWIQQIKNACPQHLPYACKCYWYASWWFLHCDLFNYPSLDLFCNFIPFPLCLCKIASNKCFKMFQTKLVYLLLSGIDGPSPWISSNATIHYSAKLMVVSMNPIFHLSQLNQLMLILICSATQGLPSIGMTTFKSITNISTGVQRYGSHQGYI